MDFYGDNIEDIIGGANDSPNLPNGNPDPNVFADDAPTEGEEGGGSLSEEYKDAFKIITAVVIIQTMSRMTTMYLLVLFLCLVLLYTFSAQLFGLILPIILSAAVFNNNSKRDYPLLFLMVISVCILLYGAFTGTKPD